jgi:hypothetical protein
MNEDRQGWFAGRRKPVIVALVGVLALAGALGIAATVRAGTVGPDVTVFQIIDVGNKGSVGGIHAYSVGTRSCNVGDTPLWWCDNTETYCNDHQHPVIAQNLYRLEDGRFEQLGLSWLKHGFLSTNSFNSDCRGTAGQTCVTPPHGGDQLGVGCTDPYVQSLNGSRPLGMRSEVDASKGVLIEYPYSVVSSPQVIDQRIQVAETDLDPTLNPGARYWVEGHYVAADDAAAGNGLNNASYQEVTVSAGSYNLNLIGSTVRERAAIFAWQAVDPTVEMGVADVPSSSPVERFHVARKVTDLGGGNWHYEYSIYNMNSERAARSFTASFPSATISSPGFHDVVHHSGEPYATTDWVVDTGTANQVTWSTDTFATDPDANALRWGTAFSFWFDATASPAGMQHTLGLFTPGSPTTVDFHFESEVFADGFESGDTSAWSLAVP